ncbi:hypothetical protein NPA07_01705 [Mycoplasmopsis caviae]|uniref:ABC-2 type transporter domain-containing protein n=1 Tax=Mycoplasmopsis caviae TaxID=55603 RepID=A0ABY5J159_9BACT|nr:hypothetical protein [Mycoplasmopsis caviae]UUD35570.1 hypothetical protein NPA07_01705 [Mycoplasmopsis caviae]
MKNLIKLNFKTAYRNKGVLIMNFGFLPIMLLFGTILILFSNRGAIGDLLSLRTLATFYLYSSPMFILMASAVTSVYVFKMPQTEGLTYVLYSKPISRSQIFWSAFISSILINLINNIIVALFLTISESIFVSVIYWKSATISFIFKILLLHIVYILSAFLLCTLSTSFISLIFSKISAKGLYGITMSIFGLAPLVFGVSRLFSSYVEYSKISPVSKLNNIKRENLEPDIQTSFIKEDYALSNKKLSNNNLKIQGISNILNINSWIVNLYDDIVLMNEKQTGIDAMLGKSKIYNYYFYKKIWKLFLMVLIILQKIIKKFIL